jgi:Asp-tRNA(Asn)/Glu-tRNA(Gln) amidotransferase B subunit
MKKYINSEGRKAHFVGVVPEGYREMTEEEIQQEQIEFQAKENKRLAMEAIISQQDKFLIATYKAAIDYFKELYNAGDMQGASAILTSPNIPETLKPITDLILQEFDK